ncbi:hypothetical protein PGW94_00180 [Candidatus Anaplasma sp. TIGMIC]|nr:hypothetical protein [Candidatus Anaplasma sp. TIGMIC]
MKDVDQAVPFVVVVREACGGFDELHAQEGVGYLMAPRCFCTM